MFQSRDADATVFLWVRRARNQLRPFRRDARTDQDLPSEHRQKHGALGILRLQNLTALK